MPNLGGELNLTVAGGTRLVRKARGYPRLWPMQRGSFCTQGAAGNRAGSLGGVEGDGIGR